MFIHLKNLLCVYAVQAITMNISFGHSTSFFYVPDSALEIINKRIKLIDYILC